MGRKTVAEVEADRTVKRWMHGNVNLTNIVQRILEHPDVKKELAETGHDFKTSLKMVQNASEFLDEAKYIERYTGIRKAVVAALCGNISARKLSKLLKVHRKLISTARDFRYDNTALKTTRTIGTRHSVRKFATKWIRDNTTPSSNTKNIVQCRKRGITYNHVVHWRTETVSSLFSRCLLESIKNGHGKFSRSFFVKCIPSYVRMKKKQDGLCPYHHTGLSLQQELVRKRNIWHRRCECECEFCDPTQCDHGKNGDGGNCHQFTCKRCNEVECPLEHINIGTSWIRPIQQKRTGGGVYWVNESNLGTRQEMMDMMHKEMEAFTTHSNHVIYHKEQMRNLLRKFKEDEIVVKADFIQNIAHSRGRETSQSYYGKRQTQFLVFVVWYRDSNGNVTKIHMDYLSSYLKHNSLYFQKCFLHMLSYLRNELGFQFRKVWIDTDGGKAHFKTRISFFFASTLPTLFGICVHWIFAPSNHGKGECDSHGAVIKRAIYLFVLNPNHHIDNENEAATFINARIKDSLAFVVQIGQDEMEQNCTSLAGSSKFHELRFIGPTGTAYARQYPCICTPCTDGIFEHCENVDYAGAFVVRKMRPLGLRLQTARYHTLAEDTTADIPIAILGTRIYQGQMEYEVQMEGKDTTIWMLADHLDCPELVDEFLTSG